MTLRLVSLLVACAFVLTGCGVAQVSEPPNHITNETDVMFLQMLVPHHRQGINIVRLAEGRKISTDVRMLVTAIEATQATEIEKMSAWLLAWGKPMTADPGSHAAHGGMPGTSTAELTALRNATDAEFEEKFLDMLIAHQDDARQLARMELAGGVNWEARDLADQR